jgi:peptidyl-prolyl cis-trans isomerase C
MTVFRLPARRLAAVAAATLALSFPVAFTAFADDAPAPAAAPAPATAAPEASAAAAADPLAAMVAAAATSPDKVVATVNGNPITLLDVAVAAPDLQQSLSQMPPESRIDALVNALIDMRLMAQAATAAGIDTQPETAHVLAYEHDRTLRNAYLESKLTAQVTEDAIKARYQQDLAKFVPGDEIHAEHILVATEDEAKAIIAQLDQGGDFATIAKAKSTDSGSGASGGDLGWFGKGATVKPFEDAAFALAVGQYTKTPVQTQFGWHVIKLLEKRKQQPPTLADRHDDIRDELAHDVILAEIAKLHSAAKISIVPPVAPAPAAPATGAAAPAAPAPANAPAQ